MVLFHSVRVEGKITGSIAGDSPVIQGTGRVIPLLDQFLQDACKRLSSARWTLRKAKEEQSLIRRCLLEADVSRDIAGSFSEELVRKIGAARKSGDSKVDVERAFLEILESALSPSKPTKGLSGKVVLVGLNGAGKTTTAGKLARLARDQNPGKRVGIAACDIRRPAAVRQAEVLASRAGVDFFHAPNIPFRCLAEKSAEWASSMDVVFFDVAGRQDTEADLLCELRDFNRTVCPDLVLLVCDASIGQQASSLASEFSSAIEIDGLVLTKLDGDAMGGSAITLVKMTGAPIMFACTGEHLEDISPFCPKRMAKRIMGHGDIYELVKKTAKLSNPPVLEEKGMDFEGFVEGLKMIKSLGPLGQVARMIPGMTLPSTNINEELFCRIEAIVSSMTPFERKHPEILVCCSRQERIARGSASEVSDVKEVLGRFNRLNEILAST